MQATSSVRMRTFVAAFLLAALLIAFQALDVRAQEPTPPELDYATLWEWSLPEPIGPGNDPKDEQWYTTYEIWKWSISSLSALGPIAPIHGRQEVVNHTEEIKWWAPDDLELLVAASIAHQASDFKDRPFGTNVLESVWREMVDDNISVGIAQLRREEVIYWAPQLRGLDLLTPEVAIRVMTAKLSQTNHYILQHYPMVEPTDRYMLLALAQNAASFPTVANTVTYFFEVAHGNWQVMLDSERGQEQDWREQLRLVSLHAEWLVEQGWPIPPGLDLESWSRIAFSEPTGR